jgi:adenylyl-sulfate kinase
LENIFSTFDRLVSAEERAARFGHNGCVYWLTGMSGAGKTTLAAQAERVLFDQGKHVMVLDGDNLRSGLCQDLGFSEEDRMENIRRAAEVCRILSDLGYIVLACFVSPNDKIRQVAQSIVGPNFRLVYIAANMDSLIERDPKGLYQKALKGDIANFTGIQSRFDPPKQFDLEISTDQQSIEDSTKLLVHFISDHSCAS